MKYIIHTYLKMIKYIKFTKLVTKIVIHLETYHAIPMYSETKILQIHLWIML